MTEFALGSFRVTSGYAAFRVGRYWVGWTVCGPCKRKRRTAERALRDAELADSGE